MYWLTTPQRLECAVVFYFDKATRRETDDPASGYAVGGRAVGVFAGYVSGV